LGRQNGCPAVSQPSPRQRLVAGRFGSVDQSINSLGLETRELDGCRNRGEAGGNI
jgi:hypothetical protein